MIVDFHTHTYPEKIASKTMELLIGRSQTNAALNGTYSDLQASMERAGVDISVLLPVVTSPRSVDKINGIACDNASRFEDTGIWSFGGIHPDNDNYKEILNYIKSNGLKGIKLHPDYQDTFFNDIKYKRIISYATELDLIVVVHAGVDIGLPDVTHCTPDMTCEVLDEIEPTKLVMAHMGGWQMWDEVINKLCGKNLYFDTAFSYGDISWLPGANKKWKLASEETFLKMIEVHGADKILFGTDSPWTEQQKSIENIKSLPLTSEDIDKILGENAISLLQI